MKHPAPTILLLLFSALLSAGLSLRAAAPVPDPSDPSSLQLELTPPPSSLTIPAERAEWLGAHYWDNLDFAADTLRSLSSSFMELNFSTWSDLLDHVPDHQGRRAAMESLVDRASACRASLLLLAGIAEEYLYQPESPFADEGKYRLWTETLLSHGGLTGMDTVRPAMQLEEMKINPVGGKATDIPVGLPDGSRRSLLSLLSPSRPTLLFFYDPDCHDCSEAIPHLSAMTGEETPAVIAVCVEGDTDAWERKRATMPATWTHVYATDLLSQTLDDPGPYILPVMPTFYLLAPDATILTKNFRPAP